MSHQAGVEGRPREARATDQPSSGGRFGAATPGIRSERASIDDLVTNSGRRRRRFITPWRVTALIAALLVAGGSYALGRYVIAPKPPRTVQIAVIVDALPAGAKLAFNEVGVITVRAGQVPSGFLGPSAVPSVIGSVLRQPVVPGTFLSRSLLTESGGLPNSSEALVGLDLKAGQVPAGGLAVGQKVLVVLLPVSSQGVPENPIPMINTTVWDLQPPGNGGDTEASVIVPSKDATTLAAYAARGQVSLVATAAPPPQPTPKPPPPSHKPTKRHGH